ncbi:CocE/NonD family hydrolase [Brevundimonas sp.]|uniref:CocE/NonD family hydrolase n=1 Tax=Brevundimonas sp. TaxID=1871086 RepID=UPI002FD9C207
MRHFTLFALVAASTVALIVSSPAQAQSTAVSRDAAAHMLTQAGEGPPTVQRLRLQLAAERYAEAEQTAESLAEGLRPAQPSRAAALTPWRIYARARGYEVQGATRQAALNRAFDELYAALPDREMATILPWYGANLDQLTERARQAEAACVGITLTDCTTGVAAVTARQALETWRYLLPASDALIRADVERRFVFEDDLLIDTPDGARITAMMVRPRGEKLTALLNFGIYNRADWGVADAVQMAAHGYAGVIAYTRGKGRDGTGDPVPYVHDGADAAAVIDWLAAQDWSDGRVGMFSGSYNSFTQWAALKHRPAALKAIATNASAAPGIDVPMQGGVFQSFVYHWPFYAASGAALDEKTYGDNDRWDRLFRDWFLSGRPYRDMERIDGRANPIFRQWLDHPDYDAFWQAMIPQGREFAAIDVPVYVQTGYFDGGMVGALHYMREHLRHRPDADHRMIIGPYHHTAQQGGVLASINGYDIDRSAQIDLAALRMQWFDHVFRDAPLPELLSGRVNFQVMGADLWRHVESPDAMAEQRLRLHLGGEGEAGARTLSEDGPGAESVLTLDMTDRGVIDREVPSDQLDTTGALQFETAPFTDGIEIDGGFTGRFEIVTNKRDLDLEVVFFEHRADGGWFRLASYLGRASYMQDRTHRRLLTPGEPQVLSFESQTVTGVRLRPGSRLVALVGVPFRLGVQINHGSGRDVSDESIADAGEPMRIRFLPGSWLELGVRR